MEKYIVYVAAYFAAISLITVFVTAFDKRRAKRGGRRVPENTLLLLAAFGGCAAEYITMQLIRHKTQHKKFMIGLPCIFILQAAACTFAYVKLFL